MGGPNTPPAKERPTRALNPQKVSSRSWFTLRGSGMKIAILKGTWIEKSLSFCCFGALFVRLSRGCSVFCCFFCVFAQLFFREGVLYIVDSTCEKLCFVTFLQLLFISTLSRYNTLHSNHNENIQVRSTMKSTVPAQKKFRPKQKRKKPKDEPNQCQ